MREIAEGNLSANDKAIAATSLRQKGCTNLSVGNFLLSTELDQQGRVFGNVTQRFNIEHDLKPVPDASHVPYLFF